jgi:uncharacterized protein YlzI (FlbEa/FlbD family)
MTDNALKDIQYELEKVSFEVNGDQVVKIEDIINTIGSMMNQGDDIVAKAKVKEVLDQVIRENYNRMLEDLWKEMEKRLDD